MQNPVTATECVDKFFDDLIPYTEAAPLLGMQAQSIPVAICRGKLPLTRYKRGRKTHLSKKEIAALIRSRAMPAPVTGDERA